MRPATAPTDLAGRLLDVTAELVSIPSVSGEEDKVLEWIGERLTAHDHLAVERVGGALVARTSGRPGDPGLLLVGHVDTVPPATPPQPVERHASAVSGRGAVDMKGGVAVLLELAASVFWQATTACTLVLYDREELGSDRSGLHELAGRRPDTLRAAAAVVAEPTGGWVELGCQGSLRVRATFEGRAAHTARPWMGVNALRVAAPALRRCLDHRPAPVVVGGVEFAQAFEVVRVAAGGPGNVLPDRCELEVNVRYAPDRARDDVLTETGALLEGAADVAVTLDSPAAPPALGVPLLAPLLSGPSRGKLGWTEVGRLARLGVPAVNFGPGDPELAHGPSETVHASELVHAYERLTGVLTA
jgi:succinyl-diaminopimelate desuccinylase